MLKLVLLRLSWLNRLQHVQPYLWGMRVRSMYVCTVRTVQVPMQAFSTPGTNSSPPRNYSLHCRVHGLHVQTDIPHHTTAVWNGLDRAAVRIRTKSGLTFCLRLDPKRLRGMQ